jgi:hypothetical protein
MGFGWVGTRVSQGCSHTRPTADCRRAQELLGASYQAGWRAAGIAGQQLWKDSGAGYPGVRRWRQKEGGQVVVPGGLWFRVGGMGQWIE